MKNYFVFLLIPFLYACQPKTVETDGGLIVDARIADNAATDAEINETIETIKNRVDYMGCKNPVITISADKKVIQVRLPLIMDSVFYRDFVLGKGVFCIMESSRNVYLEENIKKINQAILQNPEINAFIPFDTIYPHQSDSLNPLSRILSPSASIRSSIMGHALPKDTALVGSILRNEKISKLLPEDFECRWSYYLTENHCYLHVIRKPDKNNVVTSDMLADVKEDKDKYGQYNIQLSLKPEYHKILERITEFGNPIVLVIDNKVFSAPQGTSTIPNGEATLGNLSLDEAKYLVALFKYGALKLNTKIEKVAVIDLSKNDLSKPVEQPEEVKQSTTDSSVLFVDPQQKPDKK